MVGSYDIVDLKENKQAFGILTKSLGIIIFYLMRDGEKEGNAEISLLKGGSEKKFLIAGGLGQTFP